jgi:hypothetical protein
MHLTVYATIEKFPGGFNVIPYKTLESATNAFKLLVVNNLPDDEEVDKKVVDKAVKDKYWSTCEGDSEQEIILELQTLNVEE